MAYGSAMKRLSPCSNELIGDEIAKINAAPKSILDIGCGRGERLIYLRGRFCDCRLAGLDFDEENAAASAANLPECDIRCCSAQEIPFADDSFDILLCECSFSLFDEAEKCLAEMKRVLRSGGFLLLADLCTDDGLIHSAPDGEAIKKLYSRTVLESMAADAGFILKDYHDRRADLADMAAQMIFDGSFCSCVGENTAKMLFRLKAGYGLWIFEKGLNDNA